MIWLSLALSYAGLAAFALSMDVHHRAVFAREPGFRWRLGLRCSGGGLIGLALIGLLASAGVGLGLVEWLVELGVGGFALTLVLAFRPRWWGVPVPVLLVAAACAA